MNLNVIGYIIFFCIMTYVIGVVGWKLYKYGRPFLVNQLKKETHLVDPINKLLLLGYYLLNLGYVAVSIQNWKQLSTVIELLNMIAVKSGTIILFLGVMHFFNLYWLSHFQKIVTIILNKNKINNQIK